MAQPGPKVPYPSQCGRKIRPGKTVDPVSRRGREGSFLEIRYTRAKTALVFKGVCLSLMGGTQFKERLGGKMRGCS